MRIVALTLALLALLTAIAQEPAPTIDEQPEKLGQLYLPAFDLPHVGPLIITLHVCAASNDSKECQMRRAEWQRVKDEADLHDLLYEDLKKVNAGQVDYGLRARIAAISRRLAQNNY